MGLTTVHKPLGNVVADVVFVHGLNGGSHKTWTKDSDPALFWPQEWLPHDVGFRNVRIHTFGYDSNWDKGSILDIHDFARSLLEWVINCPDIPHGSEKPMILVCHSMGGLVAKKAYVLSRQHQEYERFASLVQGILFLATPHRGADLAETLSKILKIYSGARPYVGDLHPTSRSIQSINEEFPRYSDELQLFSFYETLPMGFGVRKSLVVPKESATLGYPNERTMYLDADHRGICKFDSPDAQNYRAVRNALAAAVNSLTVAVPLQRENTFPEQQRCINDSLDIDDPPEDDYIRTESMKIQGSCEWIATRTHFRRWQDDGCPEVYWISAKPGAGKSVLCGHVLRALRRAGCDPSFFFFTHGDRLKSSLSAFFRSIAWQMASKNAEMFEHLAKLCSREPNFGQADYRTIWRKLFVECAFKHPLERPQYWVIDALDECKADSDMVPYLLQAASTGFIRIFLTSRTSYDSYSLHANSAVTVHVDAVTEETTNTDIDLYLKANSNNLPGRDRAYIAALLLEKSGGCFLWVNLALQELRQGLTRKGIHRILEETPSDMDSLYDRIIHNIFQQAREPKMIMAILDWTACATRVLTTEELYHALRLDMNDEIDGDIRRFIEVNCGQLVVVDNNDRVRMVHLTARDFLFSDKNIVFRLDRKVGNKRLAMACLKYLTGPEMAGSKPRKLSTHQVHSTERSIFVTYASSALFEHIGFVDSEDDESAAALSRFLKSPNILAWIEHVARRSDLGRLVYAGNALRRYAIRRMKKTLPFGNVSKENTLFDKWATDLVRLVTKFGTHLRQSPSSIVNLIAPFCPKESAIRLQFASSPRAIQVGGISSTTWDDCVSTVILQDSTSAVACALGIFAVGMQSGHIVVFDEVICQEIKTIDHGEPVKKLLFGSVQPLLVSAGLRTIKVWDSNNWVACYSLPLESQVISLALTDEDRLLLATSRSNQVYVWETQNGFEQPPISWLDDNEEQHSSHFQRPVTTAISGDQTLVAVAYRGQDLVVWDIEKGATHDIYGKDEGSLGPNAERRTGRALLWSMIFSRAPEVKLLVAAYNDGYLNLFNTEEGMLQGKASANAHTLASSPDGLTLACGNSGGAIQIFEFETLRPLYRVQADEMNIKQLAFSFDNNRLLDIQSKHCRVWDPPVLVRGSVEEENSDTVSISTSPQDFKVSQSADTVAITSIAAAEPGRYVFCGKEDGSVYTYDTILETQETELARHTKNVPVIHVELQAPQNVLVSVDVSSRVLVHKLQSDTSVGFTTAKCLLDCRAGVAVSQVCINAGADKLLISAEQHDMLWDIKDDQPQEVARLESPNRQRWRWATHPLLPEQLVLIVGNVAHLFHWQTLERLTRPEGIELGSAVIPELAITAINQCFDSQYLSTTFAVSLNPRSPSKLFLWDAKDLHPEATSIVPVPHFQCLADQVQHLVGAYGHRVVFLHQNGWICSADSPSFDTEYYDQHFFIPADWLSTVNRLRLQILRNGTLLFVKRHELVVIRRGMDYFEHGQSRGLGKRPSLSRSAGSDPTDRPIPGDLATRMRIVRLNS